MSVYRHIVESSGGTVLIATWDKECITNFAIDTSSTSMIQSTGTTSTGTTSGATVTVNSSSVSRFCTLPISFKINGTDTCNDNSVIIEQKNPCSCDSMTPSGKLEPEPQPTEYFTINVSATNNTNKHVYIYNIVLNYQLDDVELSSLEFELAAGNTIVQSGVTIPQGHEGNTIYNITVTYMVDGDEYTRFLLSDEWWCTTGKELGEGDTLYIKINNI